MATCLVTQGVLKPGQSVVSGMASGRARTILDHADQPLKEAGPSTPVQISGWKTLPHAGDFFNWVSSEASAFPITYKPVFFVLLVLKKQPYLSSVI